jgi:hypothetical protein
MVRRVTGRAVVGLAGLIAVCLWGSTRPRAIGADAPTGTVRVECNHFRLQVISGTTSREIIGEKGSAAVPVGTYYILHSDTDFADKVGRVWRVRNGMAEKPFVVRAGQTTQLGLGGPLEARVRLRLEEGKLIAEHELWGPLGDRCEGVVVEGGALPAPRVRILDAAGKLLARPEGSYCCKFTGSVIWPVPGDVHGRLQVIPDIPMGPIGVWCEAPGTIDLESGK